jgi:hypothetical protein
VWLKHLPFTQASVQHTYIFANHSIMTMTDIAAKPAAAKGPAVPKSTDKKGETKSTVGAVGAQPPTTVVSLGSKEHTEHLLANLGGKHSAASSSSPPSTDVASFDFAVPTDTSFDKQVSEFAGSEVASSAGGDKACVICSEPSKGKYCTRHKRCYECIYRDAMTGESEKNGDKDNFEKIFGNALERKRSSVPQPTMANEMVYDFGVLYPDGKVNANKHKKRGKVDYTKYIHSEGFKAEKTDNRTVCKLDFEAFHNKMKGLRGWSFEKSRSYWQEDDWLV